MERSTTSPDDFLESLPDGVRQDLQALDAAFARVFEGGERVLWTGRFWGGSEQRILGYGTYRYKGRSGAEGEWFVVGLAAQKGHLSLYVNAVEDGQYIVKRDGARLGKVKVGSGTATFRRLADIDLGAAVELATRARDLTMSAGASGASDA